jgi:hypothetical protein
MAFRHMAYTRPLILSILASGPVRFPLLADLVRSGRLPAYPFQLADWQVTRSRGGSENLYTLHSNLYQKHLCHRTPESFRLYPLAIWRRLPECPHKNQTLSLLHTMPFEWGLAFWGYLPEGCLSISSTPGGSPQGGNVGGQSLGLSHSFQRNLSVALPGLIHAKGEYAG